MFLMTNMYTIKGVIPGHLGHILGCHQGNYPMKVQDGCHKNLSSWPTLQHQIGHTIAEIRPPLLPY